MSLHRKYYFHVTFEQRWLLTQRGKALLPVDWFVKTLKSRYTLSKLSKRIAECEGLLEFQMEQEKDQVFHEIVGLIQKEYDIDEKSFRVEISEYAETAEAKQPESDEKAKPAEAPTPTVQEEQPQHVEQTVDAPKHEKLPAAESGAKRKTKQSAIQALDQLVGATEFKQLAAECMVMAESLKKHDIVESFTTRCYLVSINAGHGMTTYLELFADLMEETGLFTFSPSARSRVVEVVLQPGETAESEERVFQEVNQLFQGSHQARLSCIDISEWMTKLNAKPFRRFLRRVADNSGKNIVFFRVPFVEKNIVGKIESQLNDLLYIKSISIVPFTFDEMKQCAEQRIAEKKYVMAEDAWDVFETRINMEKSDGRFYGINTVKKIVREMLYIKQLYNVEHDIEDLTIQKEQIQSLVKQDFLPVSDGFEQLSHMIGMETVVKKVEEIIAQIVLSIQKSGLDAPCIHMRFVGNPGTGKTTVARIIGRILKEKGVLRNGNFFEIAGRDLCGRYVGETAPKTASMCRDAYGSVLFIDEAYALYRDHHCGSVDYGKEALDTLIAEMENHRTDLMVIMAGYPDEMEKLMEGNAGLKSRMPYLIEFPNYTKEQLADIFMCMVKQGFRYDDALVEAVKSYFNALSDDVVSDKEFSNARFVRNLYERTWGKAALRCQMSQSDCDTLTVDDFTLATADKEFSSALGKKKQAIGFQ